MTRDEDIILKLAFTIGERLIREQQDIEFLLGKDADPGLLADVGSGEPQQERPLIWGASGMVQMTYRQQQR